MLNANVPVCYDAPKAALGFDMLMGNQVAPRKKFIQTHAKNVRNLDI